MATVAWKRLEKRTHRLLERHLHADHTDSGSKCVISGCQVDAVGVFGPVALVFECKTTRKKKKINLNHAVDVLAGRRAALRSGIQRRFGKHVRIVRFIVAAHNVSDISAYSRRKKKPGDVFVWTPKYFDAAESLAKAINRRALPYLLRELGVKNLARAMGMSRGKETFPALRVRLKSKDFLYSFFAPASVLLDLGYVARLEATERNAYQRLLNGSRLKDIARYIDSEETFKNSVVISLPKGTQFSPFRRTGLADVGTLKLPRVPASIWIIDGQHRIYGYANAKQKLVHKPLSVVAVHTSSLLDQGRIFVDINKNQKPVDSNLLWDLYFQLNPNHYSGVVSHLVRELATGKSSPFREKIFTPGLSTRKRSSYAIYMASVCDAIVKQGVLQAALGMPQGATLDSLNIDKVRTAARRANSRVRRFYKALLAICGSLPKPQLMKKFMLSNNGVAVFLRVFKETLLYWRNAPMRAPEQY